MILVKLATKLLEPIARAFEMATREPIKAQEKTLLEYLRRNKNTEYGKRYRFNEIKTIDDYRKLVPMSDCDTIYPYVEKMKNGRRGVLVADRPILFAATSGTTNKRKFIPVTKFSRNKKAELMKLWVYYILRDHPDILNGKILAIISPDAEGIVECGLPYGAESGHAYKNLPGFIKHIYAVPYEVFEMADYAARYYCVLRIGMEENITTLATLNPSAIFLMCQKIDGWKDRIIADIENGTLSKDFNISAKVRSVLEKRFRPNPARAAELKTILAEKKGLLPKDFWPNMALIECWKGGTVKLYLKELPQYFGDVPVRDFGCLSTEARSSVPMSDAGAGGVLAVNTNFYEFVRKDEMGSADRRFLLCSELEKGEEYFIVVTTPGGLYRYNIDDIIIVDGFFNKTPIIEFVQKGVNAVSLTGEKVYESQVNAAVLKAVETNKVLIKFFSATIEPTAPGRYVFLVEFDGEVAGERKRSLLSSIDKELRAENSEYRDLRNEGVLAAPVLKVVKNGDFERYREKKVSQGGALDGQFKTPELTADLGFQENFNIAEEIRMN